MPACNLFVDAASPGNAGTVVTPFRTLSAAVAAARPGAVLCVAEGTYAEQLAPGDKPLTLAGGFKSGAQFKVRDSARHPSRARGKGGSFFKVTDTGPAGDQLTLIDGFDISGYAQAIVRDTEQPQRFDLTNNHIHDNHCADGKLAGAGFMLNNVVATISNNVFRNNSCGRGGAGALTDSSGKSAVSILTNLIEGNRGTEPDASHGGAFYLFGRDLRVTGNLFSGNAVTRWGAGLYVGAWTEGKQFTTARLAWNVYRANRAGTAGGGLFCDDGATCLSYHEVYDGNCGGNIYLDGSTQAGGPTVARFHHLTNHRALSTDCSQPGAGVRIDGNPHAADSYSFIDALFWGNAPGMDFAAGCDGDCRKVRIVVSHAMVQTRFVDNGLKVKFGDGIVAPADPLFAAAAQGDFHLRSAGGRWTPGGFVRDPTSSPALAKAYPGDTPAERSKPRNELGAYGNSVEASRAP